MNQHNDHEILALADQLLVDCGWYSAGGDTGPIQEKTGTCQKICSDGSTRRFWRVFHQNRGSCVVAAPGGRSVAELAESRAAWHIGTHLRARGVPVPELYGWHEESGLLVFEDLGDVRLHDLVEGHSGSLRREGIGTVGDYYRTVLEHLAAMQFAGADGFDVSWCWDGSRYDEQLMLERESGYFLNAFWQGLLGKEKPEGVTEEFQALAAAAGQAPCGYFLHRDFQSRNIMLHQGDVRFIDYQGGRMGPLGYDVASLLLDPYAALSLRDQEELLHYYGSVIAVRRPGSDRELLQYYSVLAVQRNLQIVGAFAFLSRVRGKVFFADFIRPAMLSLRDRLADDRFAGYSGLRHMVDRGLAVLAAA